MNENNLTQLLSQLGQGNRAVLPQLTAIILDELHRLARHYMQQERCDHTLQATALVNEARLKLVDMEVEWQDRVHFYAIAARQMRHILVDHARARSAEKRGGGLLSIDLDDALEITSDNLIDLLELDRVLSDLEQFDERASRMFEMRLFPGLSNAAIAEAEREIRSARAWIKKELETN